MKTALSEVEVARYIVAWLEEQGFDVYQEVQMSRGDKRADIVATRGRLVVVVETKTTLGLSVLGQCLSWKGWAHLVYAGVPKIGSPTGELVFRNFGIGVLETSTRRVVDPERKIGRFNVNRTVKQGHVLEAVPAEFNRGVFAEKLRGSLKPEHKTQGEAGNNKGLYETPYRATCREVLKVVKLEPGICIKDLMAKVKHHYNTPATARACIAKWAQEEAVPGVRAEKDGRFVRLYPIKEGVS